MTKSLADVLSQIDQLSARDRRALEAKLFDERVEREWQKEVANARRDAKRDGITQETIDKAVMKVRYGK